MEVARLFTDKFLRAKERLGDERLFDNLMKKKMLQIKAAKFFHLDLGKS